MLTITMQGSNYILLSHGAGGRLTHELVEKLFLKNFYNPVLAKLEDAATIDIKGRVAFTVDGFVVKPVFFPGGDIGKLSIAGTVNDLAMKAARPVALSASFIIEEGFEVSKLEEIVESMKKTAGDVGVEILCGDTKVVEKGACDGIFIITSGIGIVETDYEISMSKAARGDVVIVSGPIAEHGVSILVSRGDYFFEGKILSDCAPLWEPISLLIKNVPQIHVLKDPTRGGVATALNEIALSSGKEIVIDESAIPVKREVLAVCDVLGIDPLYVACEGRFICILPEEYASKALSILRSHPLTKQASIIGEVKAEGNTVRMRTSIQGYRIIRMLEGEALPRIC